MTSSISSKGNNMMRLKQENQSSIRKIIYLRGPVLRSSIAEDLHLTLPTITTNVNAMLQSGILFEDRDNVVMTPGRSALPVDIVPDSRYFIGVEITQISRSVCICNYRGAIVFTSIDNTIYKEYSEVLQSAARLVQAALQSTVVPTNRICGIGVCLPGLIDSEAGKLLAHRQFGWYDKDVVKDLREFTGYTGPITVENDASSRALAAQLFLREQLKEVPSFFYLYVSIGIASPFVKNDFSLSSSPVGAGELGYMIMDPKMPFGTWGSTGSLNNLAGIRALKEQAQAAAISGRAPYLYSLCGDALPTEAQLMDSATHDEVIDKLIRDVILYLGVAIANEDNLVRPESILVDAPYFVHQKYRELFMDTLYKYSFRPSHFRFHIIFLNRDELPGAKSAAAVAIRSDFDKYIAI